MDMYLFCRLPTEANRVQRKHTLHMEALTRRYWLRSDGTWASTTRPKKASHVSPPPPDFTIATRLDLWGLSDYELAGTDLVPLLGALLGVLQSWTVCVCRLLCCLPAVRRIHKPAIGWFCSTHPHPSPRRCHFRERRGRSSRAPGVPFRHLRYPQRDPAKEPCFPPWHPPHTLPHTQDQVPVYHGLHGTTVYCTPCRTHDSRDDVWYRFLYYRGGWEDTVPSQAITIPLRDASCSMTFVPTRLYLVENLKSRKGFSKLTGWTQRRPPPPGGFCPLLVSSGTCGVLCTCFFYESVLVTVLVVANLACRILSGYLRSCCSPPCIRQSPFSPSTSPRAPPPRYSSCWTAPSVPQSPGVYGTRCYRARQVLGESTLRQGFSGLAGCHSHVAIRMLPFMSPFACQPASHQSKQSIIVTLLICNPEPVMAGQVDLIEILLPLS